MLRAPIRSGWSEAPFNVSHGERGLRRSARQRYSPRRMLRCSLSFLACLCICACSRSETKDDKARARNIVMISVDTLRPDSLRVYNRAASRHPSIDALGRRGYVFERAYSAASWTLPAHASLFTALYSDRHGAVRGRSSIGNVSSFVEALHASGYQTVGFTDGGYVSAHFGFARGFENYDAWAVADSPLSPDSLPRAGRHNYDTNDGLFDRAKAFLTARDDRRPLFLFLHTYAVHDYFREWKPGMPEGQPQPTPRAQKSLQCLVGKTSCTVEEWRDLEARYESSVGHLDREIASLLQLIDEKLGRDRTFIVLLSDHGEGFDHERGRIHHGGRLHRDQLHVPLLVSGPGLEPGRCNEAVSLVDVAPSLLELAGAKQITNIDGHSFVPMLSGDAASMPRDADAIWAHEFFHYWRAGERLRSSVSVTRPLATARIDQRYWYIEDQKGQELYEARDHEQRKSRPDLMSQLPGEKLREFEVDSVPSEVYDQQVVEQLRALGYIQ